MLTSSISAPARSIVAGTTKRPSTSGLSWTTSTRAVRPRRARRRSRGCRGGGRSTAPWTRCPAGRGRPRAPAGRAGRAPAAMFTVVVVLPTPPFWLATTITRVRAGRGSGSRAGVPPGPAAACSTERASGVDSSSAGNAVAATSAAVRYGGARSGMGPEPGGVLGWLPSAGAASRGLSSDSAVPGSGDVGTTVSRETGCSRGPPRFHVKRIVTGYRSPCTCGPNLWILWVSRPRRGRPASTAVDIVRRGSRAHAQAASRHAACWSPVLGSQRRRHARATLHRAGLLRSPRRADALAARRRCRGRASKPNRDGRVASTRTTVVGGSITPARTSSTSTAPAP